MGGVCVYPGVFPQRSPTWGSLCPPPRCLEALLLGGRGPCVLADTAELPTLTDIQVAHLKLRALCLPGEQGLGWGEGSSGGPPSPTPRVLLR